MPSGLRKTTANHFEIYYEQPWGGVASNANPVDIQPNQFVTCQGAVAINGELSFVSAAIYDNNWNFHPHTANAVILIIFTQKGFYYAVDQFGNMYQNQNFGAGFVYICTASDGPWGGLNQNAVIAVKVINGTAYLSVFNRQSLYSYDGNVTFTLGSNYVGGLLLGVLDDYLLMLNCNQATDGPSPSMISWSGPGEFTTWNPGVNQLAGFNMLATVDDQLTGFLSFASVGVAISAKSLVELSPTGVGIGPFNFTALWTSVIGQGCVYPLTVTQYGQSGYLLTDSGAYAVSASAGFSDISGVAKDAILSSFQLQNLEGFGSSSYVAGNMLLQFTNSNFSTPYYMLAVPMGAAGNFGATYVLWFYDVAGSGWYSTTFNIAALCNAQNGTSLPTNGNTVGLFNMNVVTMQALGTNNYAFGNSAPPITLVYFNILYGANSYSVVAQIASYNSRNPTNYEPGGPLNLVFRQEEVKLGRKPTIRRVLVKAYGSGVLNISVSGVSFGTITLNSAYIPVTYFAQQGMYTGEDPQLTITSTNFLGSIVKVMLAGTYADGDID